MGATTDDAKQLVDQIIDQQQVLAAAQAKHATLMLAFADTRRHLDQTRITTMHGDGNDPRYTAGEFAALEIGLAIKANKHGVSRTIGITRRLKAETPDAWDAWQAGHIDQPRAARINRALIRLKRDSSKQLLNVLVVDVAVCKTVELLGRWLNEFIARVEPDQTNDRLRRSFEDRYVSIRPDIDGISFLSAAIAAADADAINQVLNALAAIAEPGDTRTFQQRRADACTELLLGKISNGCHVSWADDEDDDDPDDADDDDDDDDDDDAVDERGNNENEPEANERGNDTTEPDENDKTEPDDRSETVDASGNETARPEEPHLAGSTEPITHVDLADSTGPGASDDHPSAAATDTATATAAATDCGKAENTESDTSNSGNSNSDDTQLGDDRPWDTDDDFDLPAAAFRPDPNNQTPDTDTDPTGTDPPDRAGTGNAPPPRPNRKGRPVITPCPHDHHTKPIPATIGVIISAQSLSGYSNTPGQLTDRSSLIPADLIRDLARQPGTLFYRLLTDQQGNLLDVTIQIGSDKNGQTRSQCSIAPDDSVAGDSRPIPLPQTRQRHRLPRRHLHQPDLHHPGPQMRPRPRHPRPRRTHHRGQPEQQLPTRTPSENPCRTPHLPRRQHNHLDHPNRPHLHDHGPTIPRRTMANRRKGATR